MMFRADDLAARQEAFRRAAPNRMSTTFGPEFDRAFAVWDARQRLRKRMLSLLVMAVTAAIGGMLLVRLSPITARDACANVGGRQVAGQCDNAD
jgi:hypothetical protein